MKFIDLKQEVAKYLYTEDDGMLRIALASIIATRMNTNDPVWMILIGPSSSGKSQVLRPLALTDEKFIHRVDDMTENTLLSGMKVKAGNKDISLLKRIGSRGIIVISDFTVIFSKNSETKNSILGQLRMVYDGEVTKYSGTNSEPLKWRGSLGILAGSTPSIYTHFEDVADMGERFIYYRMKDYDIEKATRLSLGRTVFGKELDEKLSELYERYIRESLKDIGKIPDITPEVNERILHIAMFASLLRTPTHYDKYAKAIDKVPVPEMPMRVALQLSALAKALMVMKHADTGSWELEEDDILHIEWCAYSLANEERRACLRILANRSYDNNIQTQTIADEIGLSTEITKMNLQHLSAIGVIQRTGDMGGLKWSMGSYKSWEIIRRLENIDEISDTEEREISHEEKDEISEVVQKVFDNF